MLSHRLFFFTSHRLCSYKMTRVLLANHSLSGSFSTIFTTYLRYHLIGRILWPRRGRVPEGCIHFRWIQYKTIKGGDTWNNFPVKKIAGKYVRHYKKVISSITWWTTSTPCSSMKPLEWEVYQVILIIIHTCSNLSIISGLRLVGYRAKTSSQKENIQEEKFGYQIKK